MAWSSSVIARFTRSPSDSKIAALSLRRASASSIRPSAARARPTLRSGKALLRGDSVWRTSARSRS
ncbi:MAG: hypothetical protein QM765_37435 [Myxococcales bacterium]